MANKFDMGADIDIAWCPGCGDFSILAVLKEALHELNFDPKNTVLVSGIGQAAKTPQYVNTHFFNGLHGRALPPATGISLANPQLNVIVTSGDGDMYGEGGNHFIHTIRRNPNITVFVYNNMIYGLTKGQASPTSGKGMKTPVQVDGVFLEPFNPLSIAISLDAAFVARASIADMEKTKEIMKQALEHKGFSLVDLFQPCVSFNKLNTYDWFRENTYYLEDHDPYDRQAAFAKSIESVEKGKLPLGVFYISKNKKTFNEFIAETHDDYEPLHKHVMQKDALLELIKSKVEKRHSLSPEPEQLRKPGTSTASTAPAKLPKGHTVAIAEEWDETHNVKSFVLHMPEGFSFKSGQHVNVSFADGRKVNNKTSVSLSISNPPTDGSKIIITFKNMGGFTKELFTLHVGDELIISEPFGTEFVVDENTKDNFIILSGGTGITPFMSIIRFFLAKGMKNKVVLFDGNLTEKDTIFRDELERIDAEQEQIDVVHVLSEATDECHPDEKGFITAEMIKKHVKKLDDYKFMICGPPVMVAAMQKLMEEMMVPDEKILCEEWTPACEVEAPKPAEKKAVVKTEAPKKQEESKQKTKSAEEKPAEAPTGGDAILASGDKEVKLAPGPIMKAAEELGVPFSCRQGICGTCMVEVTEGMENLEPKNDREKAMNMKDNERLCCQAKIKGGTVKIDF